MVPIIITFFLNAKMPFNAIGEQNIGNNSNYAIKISIDWPKISHFQSCPYGEMTTFIIEILLPPSDLHLTYF